ncbi:Acetyl esterase/lipase [Geodermatophilus amargosae]|uniref:Acetyl esterase/lipase n=1 Tax=Geodermatophilus amargosae TaxID=1296565 RepID=A0A1I7C9S0_9ACTN|nr:alpha/beta hydrolase fold domain-containing protein [Geodermatophilus amargosae]SFT96157.1 Acetyl esterase/lipase [Geodermatophilus amargosae]
MGGFYLGATAGGDARNAALAESLGIAVVSVDHRLAPEDPWPAAPDDCEAAALWLLDQAEVRFGTTTSAIGGSSAGATLAMTTLLRLRDRGRVDALAGAALQFGTYDLSGQTPAGRLIADEYFLEAYVGHLADRTVPDVSPVFGDLRGLPPTLLIVGASDVLLEDNLVMAARLSAAGGEVDLRVYPESPHGFTGHPTGMARAALHDRDAWLAERLGDEIAGPAPSTS